MIRPETWEAVLDSIRLGMTQKDACTVNGISEASFYNKVNECPEFGKKLQHASKPPQMTLRELVGFDSDNNSGVIYVVEMEGTNYYKIGKTRNLPGRMAAMQAGNPFPLKVRFSINAVGYSSLEKLLHKKYVAFGISGEWFAFNDEKVQEVINEIKELCQQKLHMKSGNLFLTE